jgi:nucleotide-binding universal stress UspA family protein
VKTIVVGYDESEPAKRALARAAELATAFGSKVIVTSVAQLMVGGAAARGIGPIDPVDPPELHDEELKHAKAFLAERGIDGEYNVTLGDPATEIVELAENRHADRSSSAPASPDCSHDWSASASAAPCSARRTATS